MGRYADLCRAQQVLYFINKVEQRRKHSRKKPQRGRGKIEVINANAYFEMTGSPQLNVFRGGAVTLRIYTFD